MGTDRCRWLLARRGLEEAVADAFFVVSAPKDTALQEMVTVAAARWAIEGCFQMAKGELGLDQYEVRSWSGWQRHVTLAMLAQVYLAVLRAGAQGSAEVPGVPGRLRRDAKKGGATRRGGDLLSLTLPEVRRLLWTLTWGRRPTPAASIIAWSRWRRAHQARARDCHWRRRTKGRRPSKRHLQL